MQNIQIRTGRWFTYTDGRTIHSIPAEPDEPPTAMITICGSIMAAERFATGYRRVSEAGIPEGEWKIGTLEEILGTIRESLALEKAA